MGDGGPNFEPRPQEAVVQTEQTHTCAACGAENKPKTGFCWQCYAPFAPAAPPPGGPAMPSRPGVRMPVGTVPVSTPAKSRAGLFLRIGVGVVVAIVVSGFVTRMLNPTYHVPDSLSGQPRLHTTVSQKFEQSMVDEGQKYDVQFEAAVYGRADTPDVFLVLANGRAEDSADELFSTFLAGIESAGVSVDRSAVVTGTHGDAEYHCVPVSARIQASACIWREDHSVGMTLDTSPDGDLTGALFAAYDASHA